MFVIFSIYANTLYILYIFSIYIDILYIERERERESRYHKPVYLMDEDVYGDLGARNKSNLWKLTIRVGGGRPQEISPPLLHPLSQSSLTASLVVPYLGDCTNKRISIPRHVPLSWNSFFLESSSKEKIARRGTYRAPAPMVIVVLIKSVSFRQKIDLLFRTVDKVVSIRVAQLHVICHHFHLTSLKIFLFFLFFFFISFFDRTVKT